MQTHIELTSLLTIETIQSPRRIVPLEDADHFSEMSQPNTRSQAGHAGPDDNNVVVGASIQSFESKLRDKRLIQVITDSEAKLYFDPSSDISERS